MQNTTRKKWRLAVRRFLLLLALGSVLCGLAAASPVCTNDDNLQNYINNYNSFSNACLIGDKLFWGFQLSTGSNSIGAEPSASQVNITTLGADLSNIGIEFTTGGWVADVGIPIDQIISYNVATQSGQKLIKDSTLSITGTLNGIGASANLTETLTPAVAGSPLVATQASPVSHIDFSSNLQTGFSISERLQLSTTSQTVHVSVIENDFSQVIPEPFAGLMVGSGLLVLGIVRRKLIGRK